MKILAIVSIVIVTFLAYLPSLSNGFTNWDDPDYVTNNSQVKTLTLENLKNIFSSTHRNQYKPLTFLTFALEYQAVGLQPFLYHFDNLVLHIINTLLVFWLIFLFSHNLKLTWLTALFFGIHPLHVESVAWVTERKDLLYSLFFLASIIFYFYYKKNNKIWPYCCSLLCLLLSLIAKQQAILFVFVLLLFDFFHFRPCNKKTLLEKIPYMVLLLIFFPVLLMSTNINSVNESGNPLSLSPIKYVVNACYALIFYLYKLIMPTHLSCLYPLPASTSVESFIQILSPAIVLLLTLAVWWTTKKTWKIAFAYLFFVITIAVVLRVYPSGPAIVADRYVYLASLGFFYIVSECFLWVYNKKWQYSQQTKMTVVTTLVVVIVWLSFTTYTQCTVWNSSKSLWTDVIRKYPNNPNPYYYLGNAFVEKGNLDLAMVQYQKALRIDPHHAKAKNSLAYVFQHTGRPDEAAKLFTQVLASNPYYADAYYQFGVLLEEMGNLDAAMDKYTKALRITPHHLNAMNNLGSILDQKGRPDEAIELFKQVLRKDPYMADAYYNYGNALTSKGMPRAAIDTYKKAISINPRHAQAYCNIGVILVNQGNIATAITYYRAALQCNPYMVEAHNNLGLAFAMQGKLDDAIAQFREALRRNPEYTDARNNLALALEQQSQQR